MNRNQVFAGKHLLDDAEQNIGNSIILQPQVGFGPNQLYATIIPQTNPARLLQLSGGSESGQMTTVVVTAARILQGPDNPTPGIPGPITGIIEFGNGGRFTRVEFDVPVGPFAGDLIKASAAIEPQDSGAIITVPTGVLRVYARYDNVLIQPTLDNNNLPLATVVTPGVLAYGPGGPYQPIAANLRPAEPVLVKAMTAYYSRHYSRAYKTLYCYAGSNSAAIAITNAQAIYCLPAHTKSLKILRQPITSALDVNIWNGYQTVDQVAIPSGSAPIIPIIGGENTISIGSHTVNDKITLLALACEVGV